MGLDQYLEKRILVMEQFYITFGQVHSHVIDGRVFNKDVVGIITAPDIEEARKIAFEYFSGNFFTVYSEKPDMSYFNTVKHVNNG